MKEQFAGMPGDPQSGVGRAEFIRATYTHLCGAIVAFMLLSTVLQVTGVGRLLMPLVMRGKFAWLAFMGGFMVVGWLASHWADNAESNNKQLMGLGLYVLAESIIFAPMFALASAVAPGAIPAAAFVTTLLVAGLTWTAFTSKTNFSFLGSALKMGGLIALGAIILSAVLGVSLGIWFSAIMVAFAGACVLYDTSRIIHEYPTDRPAGAALHLFASVALLLWYVLRILMSLVSSDD